MPAETGAGGASANNLKAWTKLRSTCSNANSCSPAPRQYVKCDGAVSHGDKLKTLACTSRQCAHTDNACDNLCLFARIKALCHQLLFSFLSRTGCRALAEGLLVRMMSFKHHTEEQQRGVCARLCYHRNALWWLPAGSGQRCVPLCDEQLWPLLWKPCHLLQRHWSCWVV